MKYAEISKLIDELGTNKRELARLLNYNDSYFTDLKKKASMPKHIPLILNLLKSLKDNNIDYKIVLNDMDIVKNAHKGGNIKDLQKD